MSLFLPFWWSPRIYFVHMDKESGGWRGLLFRVRFEHEEHWGKVVGFRIRVAFGIGEREKLL